MGMCATEGSSQVIPQLAQFVTQQLNENLFILPASVPYCLSPRLLKHPTGNFYKLTVTDRKGNMGKPLTGRKTYSNI